MPGRALAPVRVNPALMHPDERRLSLAGEWRFRLDPNEEGIRQGWFDDIEAFADSIEVPGCWQGQGFGSDAKDTVWDFRLEARTFRATYTGTGWYGKRLQVPREWRGMRVWLNFGGVHPSADVWLNGVKLGENHAPLVPFGFEITDLIDPGRDNALIVRVHEQDRPMGFAYNWQGNWSGLYRSVEVTATGACFVERLCVYPEVAREKLRITAHTGGFAQFDSGLSLRLSAAAIGDDAPPLAAEVPIRSAATEFEIPIPGPRLWSPDAPNLYRVDAALLAGDQVLDALSERVGFVSLSTEGKHFLINGEPCYMRGTGDFLSNPETGCPDTDRERWRKKLRALREYGYNYVRCQSFAPAPEYFDVADEVGLLVQSEMGMLGAWAGQSPWHVYAWPQPMPGCGEALKGQWDCVVMRDVNHPSANIYCMSNELGKQTDFPRTAWQCCRDTKAIKPTAFVIWTDGGYDEHLPGDFVNAEADTDTKCTKPVIQHEFRWWSSFPDVRIMHKYSGAVRPYAAEIAIEAASRHGIADALPLAAANSQRLQFVEAKAKMENCRRDNPRLAGICHFNAMDANPSPQGVIDEFYERKHADAAAWRETNGDTVILASLGFDDRVLSSSDVLRCTLFVSDFSHPPLREPALDWRLTASGETLAAGRNTYPHQPYCTCPAGILEATIPATPRPVKARLEAMLREGDRGFTNQWDLWMFPQSAGLPSSVALYGKPEHTWLKTLQGVRSAGPRDLAGGVRVVLTERLDDALAEFARAGGRIILAASEGLVRPFRPKFGFILGHYFFTPPANYPPYEDGHDGTIIIVHPILGDLPHEGFADLQFFRMIANSPPLELEPLGLNDGDPVIRVMHSYPVCRSLAYLVERGLGRGGMIICALDLDQSLPEARCLLAGMCEYAAGDQFRPAVALSEASLQRLAAATRLP